MGFWDLFKSKKEVGITASGDLITKKGRLYSQVEEDKIPRWVWKKFESMEKRGATTGSFKGKKYRYIIQYMGGGMYNCWARKRGKIKK
ncbi:hypothetical protein GYA25_00665 [Candidatus Woesearchaeota archaeon]|nr:hypothetical protein [Candidatus Woesearchaeota archaeon]